MAKKLPSSRTPGRPQKEPLTHFAKRLRAVRTAAFPDKTGDEVAAILAAERPELKELSRGQLAKYERGTAEPSRPVLSFLAERYGNVNLNWLVDGTGATYRNGTKLPKEYHHLLAGG